MSLESTPGKTISDFCGCSYTAADINHCAHFVSHFLKFDFGMNCFKLTRRGREGANVRVHEVFAECPQVGLLDDWRSNGDQQVLAFVTEKRNVSLPNKTMRNVPKKHIGIYDGSHIYHYGNSRDKVVKQTVDEFKRTFQRVYGGDLGFYFGTLPSSANGTSPTPIVVTEAPAPPSATDVTHEIRGKDVFARIGGGEEFFVARRVPFGQRIGLAQLAGQLTGPTYDPTPYAAEYGSWAYMVYVIGVSESANRFNRINSYDRAAFTFGFFQMAAHTPKDNLVLFLRRATELPEFQAYFPELQMKDGRLHRISGGTTTDLEVEVFNPQHNERQLENLMRYLNPNGRVLDPAEIVHTAKLVDLCDKSPDFCKLQVRTAVQITSGKFRDRYQHWYDLTGIKDTICVAIADIHHQGRGTKSQVRTALRSSNPGSALTKIGEDKWPERCRSLRTSLAAFERDGKLGKHKYEPAHGVFVPV